MSHLFKVALSAILVGCLAGVVSAAPVPVKPADASAPAKARQSLDKKITFKAENKSLTEVVEMLREEAKVEVTIDTSALQQFGIDVNTPAVNCDLKDAKVRDVMKKVLGRYNLRCGPTADGLTISTEEGLTTRQLRHRVEVDATEQRLEDVVRGLADQSGASVVFDPRPEGKLLNSKVTLKADDVPVETAVRLAAEIGGYSVVRMGNVLFVTTTERAEKLRPDADKPVVPANPFPVFPNDPLLFPPPVPPVGGANPPPAVDLPVAPPPVPVPLPLPGEKK